MGREYVMTSAPLEEGSSSINRLLGYGGLRVVLTVELKAL
jgi:hypothetical protein